MNDEKIYVSWEIKNEYNELLLRSTRCEIGAAFKTLNEVLQNKIGLKLDQILGTVLSINLFFWVAFGVQGMF